MENGDILEELQGLFESEDLAYCNGSCVILSFGGQVRS